MNIKDALFSLEDLKYKSFTSKLIPNVPEEKIIGVRMPMIRQLAKQMWKEDRQGAILFLETLPHIYLEENHLHSLLLNELKDREAVFAYIRSFVPYIDNWATCDAIKLNVLTKEPARYEQMLLEFLRSSHSYTVRFAIVSFMNHFLKERYHVKQLEQIALLNLDEYYVQMGQAWYLATALIHHEEDVKKILQDSRILPWVKKKTVQKARESFRISEETKEELRSL